MTGSYQTGIWAEWRAALFLRCRGYRILARRYKTPVGEIDLIIRRGRSLVFVEVKARSTVDGALQSIMPRQRQRIIRAAQWFLSRQAGAWDEIRFDVVAVGRSWRMTHLRGAFGADF